MFQGQQENGRVCVLGKVIYCNVQNSAQSPSQDSGDGNGNVKSRTSELFICDHSLQKTHHEGCNPSARKDEENLPEREQNSPSDHSLPGYVRLQVRPDCVMHGVRSDSGSSSSCPPFLVLLRDIWIVSGKCCCPRDVHFQGFK